MSARKPEREGISTAAVITIGVVLLLLVVVVLALGTTLPVTGSLFQHTTHVVHTPTPVGAGR